MTSLADTCMLSMPIFIVTLNYILNRSQRGQYRTIFAKNVLYSKTELRVSKVYIVNLCS